MARMVGAGDMRTLIEVERPERGIDAEGYPTVRWVRVFPGPVRCKWVNAHGHEAMENQRLQSGQVATLTLRHTPKIDETCRVRRQGDPADWEVTSVNDPEGRRAFIEILVRKDVPV